MKIYKEVKNHLDRITTLLFVAVMTVLVSPAYCDKLADASQSAAEGIQSTAQGAAKWLLAIVIVIGGITFIIGTGRQKEGVKEKAPLILLGLGMIVCAIPLSALIFGWF